MKKEDFLRLYPWSRNDGSHHFAEMFFEVHVPTTREKLWPFVADTSRFNRALGFGKRFEEEREGKLHVTENLRGIPLEWVEHPWTWLHESYSMVEREYSRGPFHFFRAVFHLSDNPSGGVTISVHFAWTLHSRVVGWLLRLASRRIGRKLSALFEELGTNSSSGAKNSYHVPSAITDPAALARLENSAGRFRATPVEAAIREKLIDFVRNGDVLDLTRIRPLELAERWGFDGQEFLRGCIYATGTGLLTLSWDTMCPHCRGVRQQTGSLSGIQSHARCEVCELDFSTESENAVEITFKVHDSIREPQKAVYCSAEAGKKAHIKWQQRLLPGEQQSTLLTLSPGKYRLRELGSKNRNVVSVQEKGSSSIHWDVAQSVVNIEVLGPSAGFTVKNGLAKPASFVLEELWWDKRSLRPGRLFSLTEFQEYFPKESLSPGVQLDLGSQTIFFSDIVGSTQLYQTLGDAAAFNAVVDHFGTLAAVIRKNGGVVIKTIGDAVMAAFHNPTDCLKACEEAQLAFAPGAKKVRIRVSAHHGPVIAVNWDTGKDFFGGVVNLCAKMQACANAGEVAISGDVFEMGATSALVRNYPSQERDLVLNGRQNLIKVFDLNSRAMKLTA